MATALLTCIAFRVYGLPVTQGSMRAFVVKGRPIITHDKRAALTLWREAIKEAAFKAGARDPIVGPVALTLQFFLPAPKGRPAVLRTAKQRQHWARPWRKPDLDKLERAVLDALTGTVLQDDAQVVSVMKRKAYDARPGVEAVIQPL